jgi:hypothetical protein
MPKSFKVDVTKGNGVQAANAHANRREELSSKTCC